VSTIDENKRVVVVGGGMAGLVTALLLTDHVHGANITLIEREAELGGLWRSFDYGQNGHFDYGMHNLFETGIATLDRKLFGLLPESDWITLRGADRDLAGVFYNGHLQTNTPSIDLRQLPEDQRATILGEIVLAAAIGTCGEVSSAAEYASHQWGRTATHDYIHPIIWRQFRQPLDEMDAMALRLTELSRICLADESAMVDLMKSDLLRARLAFPQQRRLPLNYSSGKEGRYPQRFGMWRLVDAIRIKLLSAGVQLLTGANIDQVEFNDNRLKSISAKCGEKQHKFDDIDAVIWSAGLMSLAQAASAMPQGLQFDRPRDMKLVNLAVDDCADADGLHYFYCYDEGYQTFRATLYANYCPQAVRNGAAPISVELFDDGVTDAIDTAIDELQKFGIIRNRAAVKFAAAERLPAALPMPTKRNRANFDQVRTSLSEVRLANVEIVGVQSRPEIFFQGDVLRHIYDVVDHRFGGS
jgi:protoporphyrinogen oxidase